MKKMKLFALMFLAGTLIFSSCNKDDDEEVAVAGPSLVFQNGNNSMEFDGTSGIDVRLDFTAEGEVSSFKLVFSLENATADSIFDLSSTYKGEKSGYYNFIRSAEKVGQDLALDATGTIKYVFTLIDKNNNTKTATYTVTAATQNELVEKTGYLYHINGPLQGAYDLKGDSLVSASGSSAVKYMINTDPADNTPTSSFTVSWNSGNGTEFVKADGFDYDGATIVDQLVGAFNGGTSMTEVTNPAVGDIYIANNGTEYYAIKITALDKEYTTAKSNNGQMIFTYKK